MKELDTDTTRILMEAHYLDALEIESYAQEPLSEMERKEFLDIIESQKDTIDQLKGMVDNFERVIDRLNATIKSLEAKSESDRKLISELTSMVQSLKTQGESDRKSNDAKDKLIAEQNEKIDKLTIALTSASEQLSVMLEEKYHKKSKSNRHDRNNKPTKKSREQEKEEDDGTNNNSGSETSATANEESIDKTKVSSENLDGKRGPRGKYTTMDAARMVEHRTTLMPVIPCGWRFVNYKNIDEFTKYSYIQCDRFQIAVYEDEFGIRHEFFEAADPNDDKRPRENVVPGTHCTAELMAEIILDNIKHALPLHRCNDKMVYDGFQVSENTRRNWMYKALELLNPLGLHLKKELFEITKIFNIDETWCRVRIKYKGDNTKLGSLCKKYIWVIVNKITKVIYFLYDNDEDDSRGTRPIQEFLGEFAGAIQSDGYIVYTKLAKKHPELIKHLECWAHVRTRFRNAFKVTKDPIAGWYVEQIGRLYLIESECLLKGLSAEETKQYRNRREVTKILESMKSKAEELLSSKRAHLSPMLRRALNYMQRGWENLLRYREDGDYTIDNSLAERSIRPYTVFRNGTTFHGSERGVGMTAFFYTLIETGKARALNIKNYLVSMIREMLRGNTDYRGILQGAYI